MKYILEYPALGRNFIFFRSDDHTFILVSISLQPIRIFNLVVAVKLGFVGINPQSPVLLVTSLNDTTKRDK